MNILFIGAFPPDFLIKSSNGKFDSLYRASKSIITGLSFLPYVNLGVITSPDVVSWPKGPLYIPRETRKEENLTLASSLNISFIKQIWTIISMIRLANVIIHKNEGSTVVMIPYMVFRHVVTLRLLYLMHPQKVIQACVVPDLFFPKKWFYKSINKLTQKIASKFDAFILYTGKMAEYLHIDKDKFIVIEGFREVLDRTPISNKGFKVVYAGSLNINYGLGRLIEAMSFIRDSDIQLHLYGSGTAEKMIFDSVQRDSRIVFHGKVSNAEATEAIYNSSVLINPRNAKDGEYTEYSFPSKDIEYLSTGIPTLLCKLPGMPSEYNGLFIDIKEASPEQIASAIINVKKMPEEERKTFGLRARNFVLERMDCKSQARRITNLFASVIKS